MNSTSSLEGKLIINGKEIDCHNSALYKVGFLRSESGVLSCTVAVISSNHVITAPYCTKNIKDKRDHEHCRIVIADIEHNITSIETSPRPETIAATDYMIGFTYDISIIEVSLVKKHKQCFRKKI